MSFVGPKKIALASFVYLAALGVAKANDLQCIDKAKEAARKMYGNCLADQKTSELQQLRRSYQAELMKLRQRHDQEVAALKSERAELRKGLIKARKIEVQPATESSFSTTSGDPSAELSSGVGTIQDASDINTPQVTLKSVGGAKVEISPLQDGNSVDVPEPQPVQ